MLYLSGFELYSRWVPLSVSCSHSLQFKHLNLRLQLMYDCELACIE